MTKMHNYHIKPWKTNYFKAEPMQQKMPAKKENKECALALCSFSWLSSFISMGTTIHV